MHTLCVAILTALALVIIIFALFTTLEDNYINTIGRDRKLIPRKLISSIRIAGALLVLILLWILVELK